MKQWKSMICEADEGKTLEEILRAAGFSRKEISRQKFIPDGITLDGEKCRVTAKVHTGQLVTLNFRERGEEGKGKEDVQRQKNRLPASWETKDSGQKSDFSILYEDDCLLIVEKPSGLSCHPGPGHYLDNLGSMAMAYCQEKGEEYPIRQIGRLDKDTSGIVVFAKDKVTAARLWQQRREGTLQKTYYAVVHGRLRPAEGIIDSPMGKVPGEKNKMCVCPGAMSAITNYRVIREENYEGKELSVVECTLVTGRTHQIRVHMASLGHPLLGDRIYGIPDGAPGLCLHAGKIRLLQPFTGKEINITKTRRFEIFQEEKPWNRNE